MNRHLRRGTLAQKLTELGQISRISRPTSNVTRSNDAERNPTGSDEFVVTTNFIRHNVRKGRIPQHYVGNRTTVIECDGKCIDCTNCSIHHYTCNAGSECHNHFCSGYGNSQDPEINSGVVESIKAYQHQTPQKEYVQVLLESWCLCP